MARILRSENFTQFSEKLSNCLQARQGTARQRLLSLSESVTAAPTWHPPIWTQQPEATLADLPAIKSWPQETKPYLTLPMIVSRDPLTGAQNLGIYRAQILNGKQLAINIQPGSGAGKHLAIAAAQQRKLPVALVFGADPALNWLAAASLPEGCDEYRLFENLFAEQLPLHQGCSQDLLLPTVAEFVVEGYISPGETCQEGPFGNHTGRYVGRGDCPLFTLTSIAWREHAIMPLTVVGPPPSENLFLGKANEILIKWMLQTDYPEIIDLLMPDLTIFHGVALISLSSCSKRSIADLLAALWQQDPLKNAKLLLLFDEDVDLTDYAHTYWRLINQLSPQRIYQRGTQLAVDATGLARSQMVVEDKATTALIERRRRDYEM